jgi:ESCRT-II complex subunit VPS36
MFLHQIDLTTALRPYLLPDETILFVQDSVGLYEGYDSSSMAGICADTSSYSKYKIPEYQNGHAYLTTHRACYVDNENPRSYAVAVDLKDVDHTDFYVRRP